MIRQVRFDLIAVFYAWARVTPGWSLSEKEKHSLKKIETALESQELQSGSILHLVKKLGGHVEAQTAQLKSLGEQIAAPRVAVPLHAVPRNTWKSDFKCEYLYCRALASPE